MHFLSDLAVQKNMKLTQILAEYYLKKIWLSAWKVNFANINIGLCLLYLQKKKAEGMNLTLQLNEYKLLGEISWNTLYGGK